jgi:hypothetical protein
VSGITARKQKERYDVLGSRTALGPQNAGHASRLTLWLLRTQSSDGLLGAFLAPWLLASLEKSPARAGLGGGAEYRNVWPRRSLPGSIKVQDQSDVETLKAELADKKIMLADIESGKVSLGGPFENREAAVRHRIAEIESQLANLKARRYPYD